MKVEVVERIPEHGATETSEDGAVKLALHNFKVALQGDDSLFESRRAGNLLITRTDQGRATCSGGFVLTLRDKEASHNRGLHFQLIQKLIELLRDAGSPEILSVKLCLISEAQDESPREVRALRLELESLGDSNEQATLRWGLGVAHLQQALLFTSRYLRQQGSQKRD